jgi:glycosyltransferase involved in cell wall biosynthesis
MTGNREPLPGPRLALVLWNGDVGGAETLSVTLAAAMRGLGVAVTLVFIEQPEPLSARLEEIGVRHISLGFSRGRDILRHPRRYAQAVSAVGPDGALLIECGFMGAALRAGGYGPGIVAVEHGAVLAESEARVLRRWRMRIARRSGAWADDVEVAVSDFVLDAMRDQPHAASLRRIYNGIEAARFQADGSAGDASAGGRLRVAFAGRLIRGKGADYLIEAVARIRPEVPVKLSIAGEGPARGELEALASSAGAGSRVEFVGLTHDMPGFWRSADVMVIPSAEFTEACPMTPLEAMACGKPVLASRNGGLAEIVIDGETGMLVAPGDTEGLRRCLEGYAASPDLRAAHGFSGRARVLSSFQIAECARAYIDLFGGLSEPRRVALPRRQPRDISAQ